MLDPYGVLIVWGAFRRFAFGSPAVIESSPPMGALASRISCAARAACASLLCCGLGGADYAEEVFAPHFAEVVLGEAFGHEAAGEAGEVGG